MFNKKDPLIDSVMGVMKQNQAQREAVKAVNETFGVTDRRQLSRQDQQKYDAAVAQKLDEALQGNQHKIDANKNGKVDAQDFKLLRKSKGSMEEGKMKDIATAQAEKERLAKMKEMKEDAEDTKKSVEDAAEVQKKGMECKNDYEMETPTSNEMMRIGKRPADKVMEGMEPGENLPPVEPKPMGQRVNTSAKADRLDAPKPNTTVIKKTYTGDEPAKATNTSLKDVMQEDEELDEATLSAKAARAGKDIGKKGKMFDVIAKKAAKRYGSEDRGRKVAGAILAKMRAKANEGK